MLTEEKLKPETCNVRLGGLRTFLKYLSSLSVEYKYLYLEACQIPILKNSQKQGKRNQQERHKSNDVASRSENQNRNKKSYFYGSSL